MTEAALQCEVLSVVHRTQLERAEPDVGRFGLAQRGRVGLALHHHRHHLLDLRHGDALVFETRLAQAVTYRCMALGQLDASPFIGEACHLHIGVVRATGRRIPPVRGVRRSRRGQGLRHHHRRQRLGVGIGHDDLRRPANARPNQADTGCHQALGCRIRFQLALLEIATTTIEILSRFENRCSILSIERPATQGPGL